MKAIYGYKNTTSQAGSGKHYEIDQNDIVAIKCWFNLYGNPSYVFHMSDGDTYLLVDSYDAMNDVRHLSRVCVSRKKDMFCRW